MSISDLMEIGKQGLAANRQALTTNSNNIANANTPGYSRQRAVMEANSVSQTDGVFIGGGVSVPRVVRAHDVFVERQLTDESRTFGTVKSRSEGLKQMENLLTRDGFEIGDSVNNFFNSFRELSANPENSSLRNLVLENAEGAAQAFRRVTGSLTDMQSQIDTKISAMVDGINGQLEELGGLNAKITEFEHLNQSPNELYDRRDAIVRDLSGKLGWQFTSDEAGHANLASGGMGVLVQGGMVNKLQAVRSAANGDKSAGNVDIVVVDNFGEHRITQNLKEGEIAGLIQVRDQMINGTLKQLDHSAYQLAKSVNELHETGSGMNGETGKKIFTESEEIPGFASLIDVHSDVKGNVSALAAGLENGAPGDNRLALELAELSNKKLLPPQGLIQEGAEGQNTIGESLANIAGKLASETAKESETMKHQESIMNQLENYRQSISGVSLEEEAVQMMQHQAVFNASAKCMRIGDELFQTILNIKE